MNRNRKVKQLLIALVLVFAVSMIIASEAAMAGGGSAPLPDTPCWRCGAVLK